MSSTNSKRNIWLISDPHFNHGNIIKYCDRPFQNKEEMNEVLIENWNADIKPNDIVYCLGDVYMGGDQRTISSIMRRLNGRKRLILGNHDNPKDEILHKHFEKIMMWRVFKEHKLLLTHVPIHKNGLKFTGYDAINIHGHIHNKEVGEDGYVCLCVEHTGYKPVHIEDAATFKSMLKKDNE